MLCINTCREIPTVNVFYVKLFKSLYNLDFRGLTLFHDATKLRKFVWTAWVDFPICSKDKSMRFTTGYLADTFSYNLSQLWNLVFFRVLNGSQLIFWVVSTHKESVWFAYKTWMMTPCRYLDEVFLLNEYRPDLVIEISSSQSSFCSLPPWVNIPWGVQS